MEFEERILKYLKTVKEATPTEIRNETGIHYSALKIILQKLMRNGLITKRENKWETRSYYSTKKKVPPHPLKEKCEDKK